MISFLLFIADVTTIRWVCDFTHNWLWDLYILHKKELSSECEYWDSRNFRSAIVLMTVQNLTGSKAKSGTVIKIQFEYFRRELEVNIRDLSRYCTHVVIWTHTSPWLTAEEHKFFIPFSVRTLRPLISYLYGQ